MNDLLDVLKGEFDVLVLPLSLPNYNALRIAEYAHRIHGALRTVLITRSTDVDQDACFFTDPLLAMLSPAWGDALRSNAPKRWLPAQEAERHIETILGSAGCFLAGNTFGGRHPDQQRALSVRPLVLVGVNNSCAHGAPVLAWPCAIQASCVKALGHGAGHSDDDTEGKSSSFAAMVNMVMLNSKSRIKVERMAVRSGHQSKRVS